MMERARACVCSAVVAVAVLSAGSAEYAYAQGLHGITIAKGCVSPLCEGEITNCDVRIGYNDDFGDTIKILAAWDVQDIGGDNVRVPADPGDLPIVAVGGNTTCTVAGTLPCLIGPGGSTLSGLPGDSEPGFVRFKQNTYVIQADDPDVLRDQATVVWEDMCDDPDTSGCGEGITNPAPAPASTRITRCDDGNDCTTDTCELGECTFTPECAEAADCDDGDACIADTCTAEGCCEYSPITCDDSNACTDDSCDPATGCVFTPIDCDDGDACTVDNCDEIDGCIYSPVDCDDGNDCTADSCDPATGCVHVPDCASAADCDDTDACTMEVCTAEGCCEYTPVNCDDGDVCTEDSCDPATGCVFTPIDCDDGDACTVDNCDEIDGCIYSPVDCDDGNDCTADSCDPATGCVHVPDCASAADCDDTDACTMEVCTAEGCCEYTPVMCDDGDVCTEDSCDPATGCVNPPIICDDGDECTEDTCDPATGCVYTPIDPPPAGCGEFAGCTPGFWKQKHHFQYWTNHSPSDLFEDVFGVDAIVLDGKTLLEAAWTGGGHEAALGRHAVAALLNTASGEVNYAYSEAEVIAMVQEAYATGDFNGIKNMLAAENERGCTVDKSQNGGIKRGRGGSGR